MPGKSRMIRINDEILREISGIIREELKDPRISAMTSVIKVDTSNDLKHCKVHVSILGDDSQKASVMEGLRNAQGYVRKLIAERVNLRNTPEVKFVFDNSLEYGMRMSKLIDEVMALIPESPNITDAEHAPEDLEIVKNQPGEDS